jgi:trigger factor
MKVTQEKLPASQIGLEIEITPEMSKQAYEKTLQEYTRSANIPGFRKGKVPRQVLIQRFGSTRIKAAVVEDLIQSSLEKALEQENIEAIGTPELKSSFEGLVEQFSPDAALTFSAAVDVPPEVNLKQYSNLQVQAEESKYDSERVNTVLEDYRKRSATLVPVERPAQEGDVSTVDFAGRLTGELAEGESAEIPGGSAEDFEIELSEGRFIPGFIEGILGMGIGDTKEVDVTFPDDYPQPDLASKPATFTITLKELKERELPELDDDFAQEVSEFETLAELRESLETRYQKEAEEKTKQSKQTALLNELVKHLEVDLPETLLRREVDFAVTQTAMQFAQQGMDIKKTFTQDIVSMLREQARPEALNRLRRTLVLGEIAKQESIDVEPEAVQAKVTEVLAEYASQDDIDMNRLQAAVQEELLQEKIFGWLEEHNTIELVPEGTLQPEEEPEEAEEAETVEAVEAAPEAPEASVATVEVEAVEVEAAPVELAEAEPVEAGSTGAEPVEAEVIPAETDASSEPANKPEKTTEKAKATKAKASKAAEKPEKSAEAPPKKSAKSKSS